jgi:hypothetical protein
MPSNTVYNPAHEMDFEKSKLNFNSHGVSGTVNYGDTGSIDYTFTDDCLLTGIVFFSNSSQYGDYANLQIVDTNGITGAPPGTVLLQPATNWYICPNQYFSADVQYPAKIIAGLTIRLVYVSTSVGLGSTFVAINYKLHKCLV